MTLSYILQVVTISITLILGLLSAYQNRKLQHGQNIISVTTSIRAKRTDRLQECGEEVITNTMPELLDMQKEPELMLKNACQAAETMGMLLHRNFEADKELIDMSAQIVQLAITYVNAGKTEGTKKREALQKLMYHRDVFKLKCDCYFSAEWDRVKRETKGKDTSSQSWIDYHKEICEKNRELFEEVEKKYSRKK